jgi:hypothetical protein
VALGRRGCSTQYLSNNDEHPSEKLDLALEMLVISFPEGLAEVYLKSIAAKPALCTS